MGFLEEICRYIRNGETENQNLGLEIEHFIINAQGEQIPFDVITSLIEEVGRALGAELLYTDGHPTGYATKEYVISLEPSCQFEISINPYARVSEIQDVYQRFLNVWEPIFEKIGYRIVTGGNLPLVEKGELSPEQIPLSPKKRYAYMDLYFRDSGKYGTYMMRASASTQVSVDYRSEADLVRKLRVLEKIAPILMILMENKCEPNSTLPGESGKPHLLRIQEWDDLDPDRTGFFPFSLDSDFGYAKIAEVVYNTPLILLTDQGKSVLVGKRSVKDLEEASQVNAEKISEVRRKALVEHFLSMGFFHFRIKKYIEIRVADSVPIEKALGYVALLKGIVYSEEALSCLEALLSGVESLRQIQGTVFEIEKNGFEARVYNGWTAGEWSRYLVQLAREGLSEEERPALDALF